MNFFPVNFTKFLRTLILHNICERLLLFFPLDLFFNDHHSKEISLCYRLETKVTLQSVTCLKKTWCFLAFFSEMLKTTFFKYIWSTSNCCNCTEYKDFTRMRPISNKHIGQLDFWRILDVWWPILVIWT